MELVIPWLLLIALVLMRVPVAFALLSAGIVGVILIDGYEVALHSIAQAPFEMSSTYTLTVIPMFVAMGIFAKNAGLAERAFRAVSHLARRLPANLPIVAVLSCAGFGAVTGSSVATAATMGRLSIGEMVRWGYQPKLAAGTVAAAGTLGIMIPPSITLVLYGIITGESVGALLIAGIIPGLIVTTVFVAYLVTHELVVGRGSSPDRRTAGVGNAGSNGLGLKGYLEIVGTLVRILLLFAVVIGGIYGGLFTATEAAAVGAAAAFVILIIDRWRSGAKATITAVLGSITESVRVNAMIFALLIGASVLSTYVVRSGLTSDFIEWVSGLDVPIAAIVALGLAALIPLGMMLDGISIILITMPLLHPLITSFGYDGIWLGVVVVALVELGLITPPVGLNVYVVAGSTPDVSVSEAFRGAIPFFWLFGLVIVLLFFVPGLVTWLPSMAG